MYLNEKDFKHLCNKLNISPKKSKGKSTIKKQFDSVAEENFYNFFVLKNIKSGLIINCELHNEYTIVDAIPEYKLRKKVFKPDFFIQTKDGQTFVVETKGEKIKKLQRDYGLRKHLFIQKYCLPNNWTFIELRSEDWSQNPLIASQENIFTIKK